MIDNQRDLDESPFSFELEGGNGAVTVSLEMETVGKEQAPTGRFAIDLEHTSGRYSFFMEMDTEENWEASGECPEFLDQDIADMIGHGIEQHYEDLKD